MAGLSKRQQSFADEYIISGNAEQSAIKAGYSEKYARGNAHKLVANGCIQEYMKEKTRQLQIEKHLSMEEALAITASIAKGEPQRFSSKVIDPETGETLKEEVSEFSASFKERNQALEHFYKINAAFIDKQQVQNIEVPVFVDDISGDEDG